MAKPITVPNTFAAVSTATGAQLDADFTTVYNAVNDPLTYSNYLTDTGGANAYVVAFSGASAPVSYTAGLRVEFIASNSNTGASTINVNSLGVKNITKNGASTLAAGDITSTMLMLVEYDGTQFQLVNPKASAGVASAQIQPITGTVAANAMTLGYAGGSLDFRSATASSGTVTTISVASITTVISSGSTAGASNGIASRKWLAVINNAGTGELAWYSEAIVNGVAIVPPVSESALITTTAEGGAGAADSAGVWYSTTARTGVAFRWVGYVEDTQATAGTYVTAPSVIQGFSPAVVRSPGITQGTAVTPGAVTSVDFTGFPAGLKRIVINFDALSINSADNILIQMIVSGSPVTSGYVSACSAQQNAGTNVAAFSTAGFIATAFAEARVSLCGAMVLGLIDTNQWTEMHAAYDASAAVATLHGGGSKTLAGAVTGIRITSVGGAATFDAGKVNVQYE